MHSDRLLERIRYAEQVDLHNYDEASLSCSIVRYLSLILNTQQGNVLIATDFGMPDLNQLHYGIGLDSLRKLERIIAVSVMKFEPRIKNVTVCFISESAGHLLLMFQMRAQIYHHNQLVPLVVETIIHPNGQIFVSEKKK